MSDAGAVKRMSRRHLALAFAALATLAASIWALDDEDTVDARRPPAAGRLLPAVARMPGKAAEPAATEPDTMLALPDRSADRQVRRNLFVANGAVAASRPAASAVALSPAVAPAASAPPPPPPLVLPFSFAGRLVTPAGPSVLLNDGAMTRVLALGNMLGDFRFEQDSEQQLDFVHVPTGERVVLALQP
jgi:hypothetical protein